MTLAALTRAGLALLLLATLAESKLRHNETGMFKPFVSQRGETVYMTEELRTRLQLESETFHWTPWLPTRTLREGDVVYQVECVDGSSIESFPDSIFTDDQLRTGGFILYLIFGCYAFILLAFVCDDYFIPTVEIICVKLNIPQNVAAATFMSVATSCPEFFVNVISTFITESDMGIGTIVGSALFNCLGVAAIGGLAAIRIGTFIRILGTISTFSVHLFHAYSMTIGDYTPAILMHTPIRIDSLPVTRDVLIYMFNVGVLVIIVWDGMVTWVEALVLQILYILYFLIMFNSSRIFALFGKLCCASWFNSTGKDLESNTNNEVAVSDDKPVVAKDVAEEKVKDIDDDSKDQISSLIWSFPSDEAIGYKVWWLLTWPLRFLLGVTIPSPVTSKQYFPLTFFMCIIWIGVNSYFVTWSMTVIGHTFFIPDSVMGMTFLAFGGCLPEACSIYIMSRRGEGGIGVSNALGANSLAILFALGLPWLIKTLTLVGQGADNPVIYINSAGIDFIVGSIIVAAACLWIVLCIGKFTLRMVVGGALLCFYLIFVTFAILVEMGIILDTGLVIC